MSVQWENFECEPSLEEKQELYIELLESERFELQEKHDMLLQNPEVVPLINKTGNLYKNRLCSRGWISEYKYRPQCTASERAVLAAEWGRVLNIDNYAKFFGELWDISPKTLAKQYSSASKMGHFNMLEEWIQHALDEELERTLFHDKEEWTYQLYKEERDKVHSGVLSNAHKKKTKKKRKNYYTSKR